MKDQVMDIYSKPGTKVKYLGKNGYDSQRERANEFFQVGEILTVCYVDVGRSSSEVSFDEYPGIFFNTVMFGEVERMDEYEAKWHNAVEENKWLTEQNERLKGNKRENPTLRDQFAMAALTGIIPCGFHDMTFAAITAYAYEYADSMLKERAK